MAEQSALVPSAAPLEPAINEKGSSPRVSPKPQRFARLRGARRVWAVSSIHGEARRLEALHQALGPRLLHGDRIVYLGNMVGRGIGVRDTLDELLLFRREVLALPLSFACNVAYLRGSQEEMWQKLLQLQFASDPRGVFEWMLDQGLGATLEAYGFYAEDGLHQAGAGPMQLTRWTSQLRQAIQARPGHYELFGALRRAAYTVDPGDEDDEQAAAPRDRGLLFVNAGLDPARPLETQKDSFWWVTAGFGDIQAPYSGFNRVIRGFSPDRPGLELTDFTATLDGGCGFGGPLIAGCFRRDGELVDRLEA